MPLILHKFRYSAAPWRLAWVSSQGTASEITLAGAWWERKRDGLPVLRELQALGLNWDTINLWSPEALDAVRAIAEPLRHAEQAAIAQLHQRQMRGARP